MLAFRVKIVPDSSFRSIDGEIIQLELAMRVDILYGVLLLCCSQCLRKVVQYI